MNDKYIVADNITKIYGSKDLKVEALKNVSFKIGKGSVTVILGPSGSGKTTLLNLLGGMDSLTSGTLLVNDINVSNMNKNEITLYRRNRVGFVFQFYNLMPNLTALENVELATEVCMNTLSPLETIEKVGLSEQKNHFPSQLSGGEQQRVSIARALAKNVDLILCDEPTGALDYETGKNILEILINTARNDNKAVVIVTHNSAIAKIADQVIYLKDGIINKTVFNKSPMNIMELEW